MGRTENAAATTVCLAEFDTNLLICVGIAAGLSKDVAIGDVCYTGTIVDVLDNAKITQLPGGKQQIKLSPTFYSTPRALVTPIALHRIHPATKPAHLKWATEQGKAARTLIPNEFSGRTGKRECVKEPIVREGVIACGLVSDSTEYNEQLIGIDRKLLALETESGGLFSIGQSRQIPALTIRSISDFAGAGIDKTIFEQQTDNNARKVAALNASIFLTHQLRSAGVRSYLERRRSIRSASDLQPSFFPYHHLISLKTYWSKAMTSSAENFGFFRRASRCCQKVIACRCREFELFNEPA
jgi:nucleoside phosphorylase